MQNKKRIDKNPFSKLSKESKAKKLYQLNQELRELAIVKTNMMKDIVELDKEEFLKHPQDVVVKDLQKRMIDEDLVFALMTMTNYQKQAIKELDLLQANIDAFKKRKANNESTTQNDNSVNPTQIQPDKPKS